MKFLKIAAVTAVSFMPLAPSASAQPPDLSDLKKVAAEIAARREITYLDRIERKKMAAISKACGVLVDDTNIFAVRQAMQSGLSTGGMYLKPSGSVVYSLSANDGASFFDKTFVDPQRIFDGIEYTSEQIAKSQGNLSRCAYFAQNIITLVSLQIDYQNIKATGMQTQDAYKSDLNFFEGDEPSHLAAKAGEKGDEPSHPAAKAAEKGASPQP